MWATTDLVDKVILSAKVTLYSLFEQFTVTLNPKP